LGFSLSRKVRFLRKAWGATHLPEGSTGLTDKTLEQTTENINLALKITEVCEAGSEWKI